MFYYAAVQIDYITDLVRPLICPLCLHDVLSELGYVKPCFSNQILMVLCSST